MEENSKNSSPFPNGPILFFDGGCALCHRAVRRLLRWERPGHRELRFAPLDGTTAMTLRLKGQLPESQEAVALWHNAKATQGEAAITKALMVIGRPSLGKAFKVLPRFVRQGIYQMTARNRHKWFGRVPNGCPMPADPLRMLA